LAKEATAVAWETKKRISADAAAIALHKAVDLNEQKQEAFRLSTAKRIEAMRIRKAVDSEQPDAMKIDEIYVGMEHNDAHLTDEEMELKIVGLKRQLAFERAEREAIRRRTDRADGSSPVRNPKSSRLSPTVEVSDNEESAQAAPSTPFTQRTSSMPPSPRFEDCVGAKGGLGGKATHGIGKGNGTRIADRHTPYPLAPSDKAIDEQTVFGMGADGQNQHR
jgi:hypothetical protein